MAGEQAGESQLAGNKAPGGEGQSAGETENPILTAYTTHAGQGNVEAQFMLGIMYQNGQGVAADINQLVKWVGKAAAQGNKDARQALEGVEGKLELLTG